MVPRTVEIELNNRAREMKGQQYIYNNVVVEFLGLCVGVGETLSEVEIYISGQTIYTDYLKAGKVLDQFQPIQEQAMILQKQQDKTLSVIPKSEVEEVRGIMLDQLRELRSNPSKETIDKSRATNETVNTLLNVYKTTLEYARLQNKLKR